MIGVAIIATVATLVALSALTSVRHTAQVNSAAKDKLQSLLRDLRTAESTNRGYLITGDADYLARFDKSITDTEALLANLDQQTKTASYRADITKLIPLVRSQISSLGDTVKIIQSGQRD